MLEELHNLIGKEFIPIEGGFVRLVDYMGNDSSIASSARVSYAAGTKKMRSDRGLLRYLMRHQHTSPFEFAEIIFHIRAPIYIARQWYRHRTANINEISGRYSILNLGYFLPEELNVQSDVRKQGRDIELIKDHENNLMLLKEASEKSFACYEQLIEAQTAREIARGILPMSTFTEWRWKIDLHNLLRFLKLRLHYSAQIEITKYAQAIEKIVKIWVPDSYEAFSDYQLNALTLSSQAILSMQKLLKGKEITYEDSGMSQNEWNEFIQQIFEKFQIVLPPK